MLADMRKNKKVLETELVKAKEKQTLLLSNFSTFKEYIEKVLVDFTGKLAAFNNKEQIYEEIAQENDELRVKCRDLVEKIKILSQNLPK
jgi:Na+-transporting NADH:ubiquinone oxidoreductase subunit NqrC